MRLDVLRIILRSFFIFFFCSMCVYHQSTTRQSTVNIFAWWLLNFVFGFIFFPLSSLLPLFSSIIEMKYYYKYTYSQILRHIGISLKLALDDGLRSLRFQFLFFFFFFLILFFFFSCIKIILCVCLCIKIKSETFNSKQAQRIGSKQKNIKLIKSKTKHIWIQ